MPKKEDFLKEIAENGESNNTKEVSRCDFPPNFVFGVSTSAYQVLFFSFSFNSKVRSYALAYISCKISSGFVPFTLKLLRIQFNLICICIWTWVLFSVLYFADWFIYIHICWKNSFFCFYFPGSCVGLFVCFVTSCFGGNWVFVTNFNFISEIKFM